MTWELREISLDRSAAFSSDWAFKDEVKSPAIKRVLPKRRPVLMNPPKEGETIRSAAAGPVPREWLLTLVRGEGWREPDRSDGLSR
jgi:hypothetical protein